MSIKVNIYQEMLRDLYQPFSEIQYEILKAYRLLKIPKKIKNQEQQIKNAYRCWLNMTFWKETAREERPSISAFRFTGSFFIFLTFCENITSIEKNAANKKTKQKKWNKYLRPEW